MMLKVVCLFVVIGAASAATWLAKLPAKPAELAHVPGCYVKEINDVIPFNTEVTPLGRCERIGCGRKYINYASCGKVQVDAPCYLGPENLNLAYPHCCPTIKCEHDNFISGSLII
ncbi:hypothetical protein JYU34_013316 [Plutella xylostella]|uniref:Single domain-containing protein n=1 Tax=Plutella xylostella TaxID=51655 RepID=A0ABQ7Q9I5_PLUXY|nr:uncharacterized protein LOC105393421 [Plutella xylostella]KAG7301896.1 hypothetical protein JYU34_013316 [Plutella xylostella]